MKIVEYRDWTQKQRDLAQKIWVKHLDKFCPVVRPKEYGCRPCDLGCSCDRCQYDYDFNLEVVLDVIDGIKITKQTFGEVTGLPEPRDGVYYIVSKIVAQACPDRHDLLIPGPAVKGEDGRPIGCNGLSVI